VIDDGNQELWPGDVTRRLVAFRQGSLVPRPPFVYTADTDRGVWAATKLSEESGSDVIIALQDEDRAPFGIVTSQSCDVDEEGKNKKPWVQVAPVYELGADDRRLHQLRHWSVRYLAPVPTLGERWAADLRIEVPLEKGWLVQHEAIDGFLSQADFDRFSEHCGSYRMRRAMATSVYDLVLQPLNKWLEQLRVEEPDAHRLFVERVTDVFSEVAGDAFKPTAFGLVFISEEPMPERLVGALDSWWQSVAKVEAFAVVPNRYLSFNQIRYAELRRWYPLDKARLLES
jgi:hypothetical protein